MFFNLTTNADNTPYPCSTKHEIGAFCLHVDKGWNNHHGVFYKGYCVNKNLHEKVINKDFDGDTGNYIIIDLSENAPFIYTDNTRSFPLFYNPSTITNISGKDLKTLYFDAVPIYSLGWSEVPAIDNKATYNPNNIEYSKSSIVDFVCEYFVQTCQQLETDLPIHAADSNGVDSVLVQSAFDYVGKSYSLVKANRQDLQNLGWGYSQLHVSETPCLQLTGFCGDELFLRNPKYCQTLLDPHGINLSAEFDKVETSYMKNFFNARYRPALESRHNIIPDKKYAYKYVANTALNDFQMWHYDNTLTFTPFRNKDLALKLLYASADAILDQVIHAGLSKAIIERLNPNNLSRVSINKNNCLPV